MRVAQKCTVARRQVDKFFLQGSGQYLKEESFVLEKLRVIFLTAVWTHGHVMWPIKKRNCRGLDFTLVYLLTVKSIKSK